MQIITKQTALKGFWSEVYLNAKKNGREKPIAEDFAAGSITYKRLMKIVKTDRNRRIKKFL